MAKRLATMQGVIDGSTQTGTVSIPGTVSIRVAFSTEQAIYGGLFLMALFLRLWDLGLIPLDVSESNLAWQAWSSYRGLPTTVQASPILIYLNSLVFLLFGANDASARALPALAGSLLVVLPYFGRSFIGRNTALIGALLLTLSPTLIFFSRYVGEATLVAAISLGLILSVAHWLHLRPDSQAAQVPFYVSAVLLGLLLASGPVGQFNVVAFLLFAGLILLLRRVFVSVKGGLPRDLEQLRTVSVWPGNEKARNWAIVAVMTLLLAATDCLTNLHGIQEAVANILGIGSGAWQPGIPLLLDVQLLLIYETLILIFALVSILFLERPGLFSWFLVWWALALLVASAVKWTPALLVQLMVPLALLAAEPLGRLLDWFNRERPSLALGILALVTLPPLMALGFILSYFGLPGSNVQWTVVAALVCVLLLEIVGSTYWKGSSYALNLWGLLWAGILLATMVHTASGLSYTSEPNPADPMRGRVTTVDVRNLANDVDAVLKGAAGNNVYGEVVVDQQPRELFGWYLRNYRVKFTAGSAKPLIIVGRQDAELPQGDWVSQRYAVTTSAAPIKSATGGNPFGQLWRWLIYREPFAPDQYESVVVYVSL